MRAISRRATAALSCVLLVLTACTDAGGEDDGEPSGADDEPSEADVADSELRLSVASFDLHTGEDQRLLLGVTTAQGGLLAFGDIEVELGPAGEDPKEVELTQRTTASFLPVPGAEPEGDGSAPSVLVGQAGAGVYEAFVDLDEPGDWAVRITAELADGTIRTGATSLSKQRPNGIAEEPRVPAVGDDAPRTRNLTIDDIDGERVLPAMVDSRAGDDDEVPDPWIHDATIAEGIEDGRPVVALFATPAYCVSRFCGPITDTFADLAQRYDDRAEFVHVEVWRDYEERALNEAAAEWIQTEHGGHEPWTFLIDENGEIAARWDNVLDLDALVDELEQLPSVRQTEAGDDG